MIGQVVLCILIGWWVTSRREAFARQYERVQLRQYEADAEQRFGKYGWSRRVVMPSYGYRETQLELFLFDNQDVEGFHDAVLQEFKQADRVRLLQVNSPNLTDEGLAMISELHSLRQLSLRSNQITDAGLAHLKQLPHLYELSVESDRLTPEGLQQLKKFPALTRLSIVGSALEPRLNLPPDVQFSYTRRLK